MSSLTTKAAVLYRMWSHIGNRLLFRFSTSIWMIHFTTKGANDISQVTEILKHVQKYRRLSKGLLDYEMVFRHLKSILFPVPINYASHTNIKSGSPTLQFHNKSSEFKKWSTILRRCIILLMLLSIPDVWIKPCQPSQHPAEPVFLYYPFS